MEADALDERLGDAFAVAFDLSGRSAALAFRIPAEAAGVRLSETLNRA